MIIESKDLIEEYYEQVKDRYPSISMSKFMGICKSPFIFIKKSMTEIDFPIIHIKYFGKFVVWPGSVKYLLKITEQFFVKGLIDLNEYLKRTVNLKQYLNEYENQDSLDS